MQNSELTLKSSEKHYPNKNDNKQKIKRLISDHEATICFEVLETGNMNPSVAFHFGEQVGGRIHTDLVSSDRVLMIIKKLRATHQQLLSANIFVELGLQNEHYQQQGIIITLIIYSLYAC